jgi:hypothetical protein
VPCHDRFELVSWYFYDQGEYHEVLVADSSRPGSNLFLSPGDLGYWQTWSFKSQ